jgi:hypothetical protein
MLVGESDRATPARSGSIRISPSSPKRSCGLRGPTAPSVAEHKRRDSPGPADVALMAPRDCASRVHPLHNRMRAPDAYAALRIQRAVRHFCCRSKRALRCGAAGGVEKGLSSPFGGNSSVRKRDLDAGETLDSDQHGEPAPRRWSAAVRRGAQLPLFVDEPASAGGPWPGVRGAVIRLRDRVGRQPRLQTPRR